MTYYENTKSETHPQNQESVHILRMIRIEIADGVLIQEDRLSLLERHPMLPLVLPVLPLVPFKTNLTHMYRVRICPWSVERFLEFRRFNRYFLGYNRGLRRRSMGQKRCTPESKGEAAN
jgi:hypothetical protein